MIKENELRIGNWIELKNSGFIKVEADSIGDIVNNPAIFNCIPITPEILEKAGWIWNEECNSFEKYPNGDARMNLQRKFNGGYTMFNYVIKALICENIWHLHQLQNLYYALTGTELEISL
jgi:hypothetical protein